MFCVDRVSEVPSVTEFEHRVPQHSRKMAARFDVDKSSIDKSVDYEEVQHPDGKVRHGLCLVNFSFVHMSTLLIGGGGPLFAFSFCFTLNLIWKKGSISLQTLPFSVHIVLNAMIWWRKFFYNVSTNQMTETLLLSVYLFIYLFYWCFTVY